MNTPLVPQYLDQNISWVDFNERVLEEGLRRDLLPLDRYKYLSIVSSNFDEFFMVRVAALKRALENDAHELSLDEELETITRKIRSIHNRQYMALREEVFPGLAQGGLSLLRPDDWNPSQKDYLSSYFLREILPLLTPLRVEEELPSMENLCIYAAFLLEQEDDKNKISIVRIPEVLNRIVRFPQDDPGREGEKYTWVLLEDLVLHWGDHLYPGYNVRERFIFTLNRDAAFTVDENADVDFIEAMEEVLEDREKSMVVRMSYTPGSRRLRDYIAFRLNLRERDLYEFNGPLNLGNLYDLVLLRGFDQLRTKTWKIHSHPAFSEDCSVWDPIREKDVILHLPYQSFDPIVRFFREAASDPQVLSIKTTLYRTSENSPIIRALELASMTGKHVTAVVELKARFDEKQNISWVKRLEKAGVIVVYGLARLKVHAKVCMVIRREMDRLRRYVHLSTGNYNDITAKFYEDISIFTARDEITYETGILFNMITGYSESQSMRRLVMAPRNLKGRLLYLIEREISHSSAESPGRIMAKMNALSDRDIINALYKASQAGVEVLLNVRGICLLVPGTPGISDNIKVIGIIDHYLEHSRIYYFANGGDEELYLSSADWMPRNLEHRVELMFPVLQDDTKQLVMEILKAYFLDNSHAWSLNSHGSWSRVAAEGEPFQAQKYFLNQAEKRSISGEPLDSKNEGFVIRRKAPG